MARPTDIAKATETVVPLRWRDMDAYGHVNHAVYLTYLEQGRDAALARVLRDTPGETGYVVARLEIDYRREIRQADGPVVVSCWFTTIGRSSVRTRETIVTANGELAAEAEAVIVSFDRETRRSRPWTDEERKAFAAAGANPHPPAPSPVEPGEGGMPNAVVIIETLG